MSLPPAKDIARALNARQHSGGWLACCPAHDDKEPSLTIKDGSNGGVLLHCWSGCSFKDVARAIEAIAGSYERDEPRPAVTNNEGSSKLRVMEMAFNIWQNSTPLCKVSKRYLERRGILNAPGVRSLRSGILKHPQTQELAPAIIVPIHTAHRRVVGIQRIFLDEADCTKYRDGQAKFSLGGSGFARLSEPSKGAILLTEGPENALAAELMFKGPAWACCGGFPQKAVEIEGVKKIAIICDNDRADTSVNKANAFIAHNPQFEVKVWVPKKVGQDVNDVWCEKMCEGAKP